MIWTCAGCGDTITPPAHPLACPNRGGDDIDHLLAFTPRAPLPPPDAHPNPFVAYRRRLYAWEAAMASGMSDAEFVAMTEALDAQIAQVTANGNGFRFTPCVPIEVEGHRVWVKDETGSVGGSHKARHLMGVALYLDVAERAGKLTPGTPLAIASCGNAALAAAVVARAARRKLQVFIPTDARASVVARLRELEAHIVICEREPGTLGDPTYTAFQRAVAEGALPFCCQGPDCGLTLDGGRTLAWEMEAAVRAAGERLDRVFIQVGGGAFMSSVGLGLEGTDMEPRLHAVQTRGCYPLARAFERVRNAGGDLQAARQHRSHFMAPWEETPHSIAHGILDDETYDWAMCVEHMQRSGGSPVVVADSVIERAVSIGRDAGVSEHPVSPTGAAGLAGVLALKDSGDLEPHETLGVVFSGVQR